MSKRDEVLLTAREAAVLLFRYSNRCKQSQRETADYFECDAKTIKRVEASAWEKMRTLHDMRIGWTDKLKDKTLDELAQDTLLSRLKSFGLDCKRVRYNTETGELEVLDEEQTP
jgi:hypothetical protein